MQAYSDFKKQINVLLHADSPSIHRSYIIEEFEKKALDLCLSFDTKIQSLQNEISLKNNEINVKNNEMIKIMEKRLSLTQELHTTKESARSIVKYLNLSMKASSHVIARTIIEMIGRENVHSIDLTTRILMENFQREKHLVSDESQFYFDYRPFSVFFLLVIEFEHN